MSITKSKGDLAEQIVLGDLARQGYKVAIPFGDDWDYDLIVAREPHLERVQVKYTRSDGAVIRVKAVSYCITAGRVTSTKRYTATMIDWLAVYDATSDCCYYIPSDVLGLGKNEVWLRLTPPKNGARGSRYAKDYRTLERQPTVK